MGYEIAQGEVVELMSGSASMTVGHVFTSDADVLSAQCFWYEPAQNTVLGDVRFITIPVAALRAVDNE